MPRPSAALLALLLALPARAGELRGTVRLGGAAPLPASLAVSKDRQACGESVPDETLQVKDGLLANAVIQVRGLASPPAPARGRLDQVGCRFAPHVQALPRGSTLDIASSDPVLHNVHGWVGRATAFNQAMASKGQQVAKVLERPGIIQVRCDVHDWMSAWVLVTEGPAAVSGADGRFAIAGLPAGRYTVLAWHERYGELVVGEVEVPATGAAALEVAFGR
jgi:plastocyanin